MRTSLSIKKKLQLAAVLVLLFASCSRPSPKEFGIAFDSSTVKVMSQSLKIQHDLLLDTTKMYAQQSSFPTVVAHKVIADLREGDRLSSLVLELQYKPGGATTTSEIKCDINRLNVVLKILENENVLYDEKTRSFSYATKTYSFLAPITLP